MGGFVGMRMAARRRISSVSLILLETSSDPEPTENLTKYRLMIRVVRLLGPRVVRVRSRDHAGAIDSH